MEVSLTKYESGKMIENPFARKFLGERDLHIHSVFSDGAYTPEELVNMYIGMGFKKIALTDHDGTGGIERAKRAAEGSGLEIITGIEIGTLYDGRHELHILGYSFDKENPVLIRELEDIKKHREKRNKKLLGFFQDSGFEISSLDFYEKLAYGYIGKPDFAVALRDHGYVDSVREAFNSEKMLGSPQALAMKKKAVDTIDAIRWIVDAGGIAVLAHPMEVRGFYSDNSLVKRGSYPEEDYDFRSLKTMLVELKKVGLSGIECVHPSATHRASEKLKGIAENLELIQTAGSDFHGLEQTDRADRIDE